MFNSLGWCGTTNINGGSETVLDPNSPYAGCSPALPLDWGTFTPFKADVYYPTTEQSDMGEVVKVWKADKTIGVDLNASTNYKDQQIQPDQFMRVDDAISARSFNDVRISSSGETYPLTDIRILNVRDVNGRFVYWESGGSRKGRSTVFEVDGITPHTGAWGDVDHFSFVIRRCPDQEAVIK